VAAPRGQGVLNATKKMQNTNFRINIKQDEDGIFIGSIPAISSCYAQGKTKKQMLKNLQEALLLCLKNNNIKLKKIVYNS
jgi:predicted RNase H-like HicB family nuclease